MIPSNKKMPIDSFLWIDRNSEGLATVYPAKGEKFVGIPYGYYGDESGMFIVRYDDKNRVQSTYNCSDISLINFSLPQTGEKGVGETRGMC